MFHAAYISTVVGPGVRPFCSCQPPLPPTAAQLEMLASTVVSIDINVFEHILFMPIVVCLC